MQIRAVPGKLTRVPAPSRAALAEVHCERALCCRLQDLALPAPYLAVQHPAMLGTAVKLDEGTVRGEAQIRIGISGLHSVRNGKDDCCREKVG